VSEFKPQGGSGETSDRRHERRDLNVKAVAGFAIGLVLTAALLHGALVWMFGVFEQDEARQDRPPPPLAEPQARPPAPRLQEDPTRDLRALREREEAILTTYGWVDPATGIIRIPIDRALELLAERGLPSRETKP
jgi:hypothetical protein